VAWGSVENFCCLGTSRRWMSGWIGVEWREGGEKEKKGRKERKAKGNGNRREREKRKMELYSIIHLLSLLYCR